MLHGPADLPSDKVSSDLPFSYTGVDFAGLLYVHQKGSEFKSESKSYMCLCTCTSTRAIHLELTNSFSVEQFLLAFRKFFGCRGLPATIWFNITKTF